MDDRETIAAIASSSKNGSVSVIRVSGKESLRKVSEIFYTGKKKKKDLMSAETHTVHYGFVCDDSMEILDEVLVLVMRAPRSYTAEDVVEIQCHGGFLICQLILKRLLQTGVRIAEPGEFTKRAFLNGRIDLSQAESVMDVIQAESRLALGNSISQLRGNMKEKIKELREVLLTDIAFLEAALDDPEHISLEGYPDTVRSHTETLQGEISRLLENSENGRRIKEGIRTVIVGKPNVGKSSFMNRILREDRAIVTDIPGTTRDTLEEELQIGSILLRLVDTAGIRETEDVVERIGVEKAERSLEGADLVICILDASGSLTEEDRKILEKCRDKQTIVLLNKSDLKSSVGLDQMQTMFASGKLSSDFSKNVIRFSALTGDGLEELEQKIRDLVFSEKVDPNTDIYITNLRQKQALLDAQESLRRLCSTMDAGMPEDLYSIDMTDAYEALGRIIGETLEEDIIDKIFQDFCMGK